MLTALYAKSDAALFGALAASVERQSLPCKEWIIAAQGPLSPELRERIESVRRHPWTRIIELPTNLGIVRSARLCLDAAQADYVVPVDGDDLLTLDALQVLACALSRAPGTLFMYSDEDQLIDGVPAHPYWRPDWDPVLNLESSYVWHLSAFHRESALRLGVFTDAGADWCHDWDNVTRFANAGHVPLHVPEVLYHWRQHPASGTNRPGVNPGSLRSTHHVLARQLARQASAEHFELAYFPINRGVPEWHIARRRTAPAAAELIVLASDARRTRALLDSVERHFDYRPASIREVAAHDHAALASALAAGQAPIVWLVSDSIVFEDDRAPWEALRLLELHPRVQAVSGRLVDGSGRLAWPWAGAAESDPGPYALALKPHTIEVAPADLVFARRGFLADAVAGAVAYSPLVRARVVAPLLHKRPATRGATLRSTAHHEAMSALYR